MHLFFSWIATLSFCVIWQMDRGWATHRFQCVLVSTPRHACVHWPSRLCRLQWPGMFGRPNLDSADPIASPGWIGRSTGDFRRFLESYTWNIRREADGYDFVIVDEYHLFNDTERYILHLLTRDPNQYPRIVMAMDPRQSAYAILTGRDDSDRGVPVAASKKGEPMP